MGSWNEVSSHQTLKKDEFYALLSVADLAVITPLRDGMNTTSMEFVIAQEKTNKSPCVLSEFMGISKNMEHTLLVNPWNLGVSILSQFLSVLSWFDWSVHPTVQMDVWHGMITTITRLLLLCGASSGSGGRNQSGPSDVSVGEGCKACQIVQGCHNAYIPFLGFDTCQTIIGTTQTTGDGAADSLYSEASVGTVVYFGEEEAILVRLRCKLSSDPVDLSFVWCPLMLIAWCLVLGYPHSDCEDTLNGSSFECNIGSPGETR